MLRTAFAPGLSKLRSIELRLTHKSHNKVTNFSPLAPDGVRVTTMGLGHGDFVEAGFSPAWWNQQRVPA
jgi:hypothetical protein